MTTLARRFVRSAPIFALVLAALAPSTTQAQDDLGELRLAGYFALGLGGELEGTAGSLASTSGLDATVGFGLRGEVPLHAYFALGGSFELLFFEASAGWAEREAVFDFAIFPKLRYRIALDRGLAVEPYLGVPFGLTLAVLASPSSSRDDEVWPGFHTGVMAGAMLFFDRFGLLFELGWRHHQVFNEANSPFGSVDLKFVTNQFAMNIGAFLVF
jgi:hypothetical protein